MKHTLKALGTLLICIPLTLAAAQRSVQRNTQIQFTITNTTDKELTVAALYTVKPPKHPGLLAMPNPFVFASVPAHSSAYNVSFKRYGGGRLGAIEKVFIRAGQQDLQIFDKVTLKHKNTITINQSDINAL